jgi:hypothetical protein
VTEVAEGNRILRRFSEAAADDTALGRLVCRVLQAGALSDSDEAALSSLTREIDVRRRLNADYADDFSNPLNDAAAAAPSAEALAALFLLSASQAAARQNRPLALKRLNSGLKALDIGKEPAPSLREALLAALDRFCPGTAP